MLYYRRKILLALLEVFDGRLTAKQLQKYLFLVTRMQQGNKAFDFIPYHYGCFSFQANQDMLTLEKYGYLKIEEEKGKGRFYTITSNGMHIMELDMFDQQAIRNVKEQFGEMSQNDLIKYTYQKYPYYAIKSDIAEQLLDAEDLAKVEKQKRHYEECQLFSIGYEGMTLESYINRLIINDVHVLCDVRRNAYSQKYGFSKAQLKKACDGVGIKYVHVPQLGIESDKRQDLRSQRDYDILFEEYERTTLKKNYDVLLYVRSLLDTEKRIAVTCFEKDPRQCHRTRVAKALLALPNTEYNLKNLLLNGSN